MEQTFLMAFEIVFEVLWNLPHLSLHGRRARHVRDDQNCENFTSQR